MATTRRKRTPNQPKQSITRRGHCRPKTDPTLQTSQEAKEQGQVRLAIWSSKLIPEEGFNSKAEYTNAQQDLTVNGYTQSTQLDYAGFCKALVFLFAEKQQRVGP